MNKQIAAQQRYLREQNKLWPEYLSPMSKEHFPDQGLKPQEVWRSSRFLVQIFECRNGAYRMSVNRTMIDNKGRWLDSITWEELMALKRQCCYGEFWAVEIYPHDDEIVNVSNMRHLWLLLEPPAFAWRKAKGAGQ